MWKAVLEKLVSNNHFWFQLSYEIDRSRWTIQMTERTKSFITWSSLVFDLQHSKSNWPKRILTFFRKKRLSFKAAFQTKQVWHSYVFNVNVYHVLQEKGEENLTASVLSWRFSFFAQNWVIKLALQFFTISDETEWKALRMPSK